MMLDEKELDSVSDGVEALKDKLILINLNAAKDLIELINLYAAKYGVKSQFIVPVILRVVEVFYWKNLVKAEASEEDVDNILGEACQRQKTLWKEFKKCKDEECNLAKKTKKRPTKQSTSMQKKQSK